MASRYKVKKEATEEQGEKAKKTRERKPGELSRFQKTVIVLFIVVFALSTLAGALASVFQSQNQSQPLTVETIDENYEGVVADLEAKVAENPEDTESLKSLGDYCSSWAMNVSMLAASDEDTAHSNDLLTKAIGYYDQYLALEDSNEVATSRAMCFYYQGDTATAVTTLQELTAAGGAEYAPAWADLGLLYEQQGSTDEARAAYEKAAELDPEDEAGVKSYAEGRISQMDEAASDDDATADDAATDDAADGTTDDADAGQTAEGTPDAQADSGN